MFLTSPYIDQAISLKFRLLSIQFSAEAFETGRKMSVMGMLRQLRRLHNAWHPEYFWLADHPNRLPDHSMRGRLAVPIHN
jgi:hypothetical protein